MTIEVVWTRIARDEVRTIYKTIGQKNLTAADRVLARIEQRVAQLADHPRLGSRRPDIRRSTRILVAYPYLILYETVPDTDAGPISRVNIVTIVDGRRNLLRDLF